MICQEDFRIFKKIAIIKVVNFTDWINEKFFEWRGKSRQGVTDFAKYLDIKQPLISKWLNGRSKSVPDPTSIAKLADKFPDIYEVLGFPMPDHPAGLTIPLVGRVRAGQPIPLPPSDFTSYDPDSSVVIARSWLPPKISIDGLFALEVEGDSMKDMGIEDGTTIILKRQSAAEDGDIVVVSFDEDDSRALRRFYRVDGKVKLKCENPKYTPIVVDETKIKIIGKLVMLIRVFK